MATTVISSIIPGGGGDYTTLADWVTAKKGNLVTRDTIEVAEIHGGGTVGALHLFRGEWTVNSTHYPVIRAAALNGHGGVWSSTGAFIKAVDVDDICVEIEVGFTRFGFGISVENNGNPGSLFSLGFAGAAVTPSILVDGVIARQNTNDVLVALSQNNAGNPYTIRNSVFFKHAASNNTVIESAGSANLELLLYNSVMIAGAGGSAIPLNVQVGTVTEQNNYFRAPLTVYDDGGGGGTINKGNKSATSTAEAVTAGLRNIANDGTTFNGPTFNDGDWRIHDGSPLIDAGADLTASGVTTDLVGTLRPQRLAFDIGAHELEPTPVSGGGKKFFIFGI